MFAPTQLCDLALALAAQGDLLHLPGAVCVLRSQLARANKYYSYESTGVLPQPLLSAAA